MRLFQQRNPIKTPKALGVRGHRKYHAVSDLILLYH